MFLTGLAFLSTLTSVNLLSAAPLNAIPLGCISMKNEECNVRPQIFTVNSNEPVFFPFSIKTSNCSGSCNNIHNSYPKLCAPDVECYSI